MSSFEIVFVSRLERDSYDYNIYVCLLPLPQNDMQENVIFIFLNY